MNFKEMCRTCLRSGEMMSSLFVEKIEPAKHTAADLLAMFTSVQIDKEDDFPHNICDICLKEIQQAYLFDLKCKKSEIILHQLREIRVNLKKLNEIPKQNDIVSKVADELESILKEDFKFEDVMSLCGGNISDSESNASERIRSAEEENANTSEKLTLKIVEDECTRDFQLAFKREPDDCTHLTKDLEGIQIVYNFQIVEEDYDPQITLKQELDYNRPINKNNVDQNELQLTQNSSNFKIFDECATECQVIFNTELDQNDVVIKGNDNEEGLEYSEMSSNFQDLEEECVPDIRVTYKSEPELDIGIDCYDEKLECLDCLKQFQSLDMFRDHIVSDHLEENICKLCNEEFECSQFEHSAKHLPFSKLESPSGSSEKSRQKVYMTSIQNDEFVGKPDLQCKICSKVFINRYRLVNHMRTYTDENPFDWELLPEKSGNSTSSARTNPTDELINNEKLESDFQCSVCSKVYGQKYQLKNHMLVHTDEKPFECEFCPEKFQQSHALLGYRRSRHRDELINDDKPVPDLQCSVCYKFFGEKYLLRKHMRTHTGEKPFDCELCPVKFKTSSALLCHKRTKHTDELISDDKPEPEFQCNVCYKVFGMKCLLKNHMRTHTGEKPIDCQSCPEKFINIKALRNHRRTKHTDEFISDDKLVKDLQCNICSKIFGHKYVLRDHMRVHTGEKPFQCELCPAKFRVSKSLLCHRRSKHTDKLISDLPVFQCNVCSRIFGQKYRLKDHMRVHTGEKPFQCELCPEKFQRSQPLLLHRRTKHRDELISDDKPVPDLQCSVCYKLFGEKFLLRKHMRTHTGEKPFDCELCPVKFKTSSALLCHKRTKHTDELISDDKPVPEFQCSVCYKVFGMKCLLKNHMRTHTGEKPIDCQSCPEKFINIKALRNHRRTKHTDEFISDDKLVKDLQCSICSKIFGHKYVLRDHMRVHTGEKPFQCELCPAKFRVSKSLLCHRRSKHTDKLISNVPNL